MNKKEPGWLQGVAEDLDFDDPSLTELFPEATLIGARQAFRLLTA